MIPMRRMPVAPGVYQLKGLGARVTWVEGKNESLLIDTGARGSWRVLLPQLTRLGAVPGEVTLVVLTHSHPDHSGELSRIVEATSARVAVHRAEADFINGEQKAPNPFVSQPRAGLIGPFLPALYGKPVTVDFPLGDGDTLPFSREVQVIHTPGHTAGSTCYLLPDCGVMVVGDAMQHRFRRLGPPMDAVTQDPAMARDSIRKLLGLEFHAICFGHFNPIIEGAKAQVQRLVSSWNQDYRRPGR